MQGLISPPWESKKSKEPLRYSEWEQGSFLIAGNRSAPGSMLGPLWGGRFSAGQEKLQSPVASSCLQADVLHSCGVGGHRSPGLVGLRLGTLGAHSWSVGLFWPFRFP